MRACCPACGADNRDGARFCDACGGRLAPSPDGRLAEEGELRPVTVLFADISGFTALGDKMDPEALRNLMKACFDFLVPFITRYGGTVDKFVGDEVMALFGAPMAHEDDPERALRAVLEMREALEGFNRERSTALSIHAGVNSGLVFAGGVGGGGREDYSVMGDAVNLAARLKDLAKAGEILVGADTYRRAAAVGEWQEAGSVPIRGKPGPVTVHRLLAVRRAGKDGSPAVGRLTSPLVGRLEELDTLGAALGEVLAGSGGVVIVTGEAGVGKSRLVAELRDRAQAWGAAWLEGHALSFGRTISYWPFLEIIQLDAGIDSDDAESERWAKVDGRVTALFGPEREDVLPYLATLLNLPIPEDLAPKVRGLGGEGLGHQVYRAMRLHFARLAAQRPTVVVFEDVHWLDGSSAALIEHLLPLCREAPLLFLFVSRPDIDAPLARLQELVRAYYPDRLRELFLAPLGVEETALLVRNLTGLDHLPAQLRDLVLGKAEGNPFFVEEVLRSLVDLGGLVQSADGSRHLTERAGTINIPDSLQAVIMARIDRLDEDVRRVLRLAAVAGRSFFYRVLAAIDEAGDRLDEGLSELENREFVLEKARIPELEYMFTHALVQEATYETILLERRRYLHRRVADAMETLFTDRLPEFYALLAYHYSRAEDWEKAQEYLLKAGDQAGGMAADAEAVDHYEQALAAFARAFGDSWDPLERAMVERKMGEALQRRGEQARAAEHLTRSLALMGVSFPNAPTAVRRAVLGAAVRQLGHRAAPWAFRRSPQADELQVAEEIARAYYSLGWVKLLGADPPGLVLSALRQLNHGEETGVGSAVVWGCNRLCAVFRGLGLSRLDRWYSGYVRRLGECAEDEEVDRLARYTYSIYQYMSADWEGVIREGDAAEPWLAAGDVRAWASALSRAYSARMERGSLLPVLVTASRLSRMGDETGDRQTTAWGHGAGGLALLELGRHEEAQGELEAGVLGCLPVPDLVIAARLQGGLARCLLEMDRVDEARQAIEDRERIRAGALSIGIYTTNVYTTRAAVYLRMAEGQTGSERERSLATAAAAISDGEHKIPSYRASAVPLLRLRGTQAWLSGHERRARRWWQRSLEAGDRLDCRLEATRTRLEMGRRLGDRDLVRQAETELEAMRTGT